MPLVDRRTLLAGGLAGVAVVAFDPLGRQWVSAAEVRAGVVPAAVAVPGLDGVLLTDPASLAAAAEDFGHIVHRAPVAVLRPGSVRDVVARSATPTGTASRWRCGGRGTPRSGRRRSVPGW